MQIVGNFIAIAALIVGVLWIAQQQGLLPGNFLYSFNWGPRGPVAVVGGLLLLFLVNFNGRRRR